MSQVTRKITVFSTKGQKKVHFDTDVTTWGELRELLKSEYSGLDNMGATEGTTFNDLIHKDAVLPSEDFTLFLRPLKTKSGIDTSEMTYKDMKEFVKENKEDADFMTHLSTQIPGKNWTQAKAAELTGALESWNPGGSDAVEGVELPDTDAGKLEFIQTLVDEINERGEFEVTFSFVEGCDEDCKETKDLEAKAKELLKGF